MSKIQSAAEFVDSLGVVFCSDRSREKIISLTSSRDRVIVERCKDIIWTGLYGDAASVARGRTDTLGHDLTIRLDSVLRELEGEEENHG